MRATSCEVSRQTLFSLADGEAGEASWELAEHWRQCPLCQSRMSELAEVQADLASHLHAAARRLDPLAALLHIRRRRQAARPLKVVAGRLRELWAWHFTFARGWVWLAAALLPPAALLVAGARWAAPLVARLPLGPGVGT